MACMLASRLPWRFARSVLSESKMRLGRVCCLHFPFPFGLVVSALGEATCGSTESRISTRWNGNCRPSRSDTGRSTTRSRMMSRLSFFNAAWSGPRASNTLSVVSMNAAR